MLLGRIPGATRNLGAPANWSEERDGLCGVLPIRDVPSEAGNIMLSAWMPTPEEQAAIAAGASVYLYIYGTAHPVVAVGCGPVPDDDDKVLIEGKAP